MDAHWILILEHKLVDYIKGEALYREFIEFRYGFISRAVARASHTDVTSDGRQVRPVVVLPFREVEKVQAEIDRWSKLVAELEQYPDLGIPKTLLYPIPAIIRGVRKATAYNTEAINSRNVTAGHLIHLIDKDIRGQKKGPVSVAAEAYIANLENARRQLASYPDDEPMRMRIHGYRETLLNLNYISTSPNYKGGRKQSYHVPTCGVFICDETLRDGLTIGPCFEKTPYSVYDAVEPIICNRWPTAKIYRTADIEEVKASRTDSAEAEKPKSLAASPRVHKTSHKIKTALPVSGQ